MDKFIFLRSQYPKTDSRLQRYLSVIEQKKISYFVVGWDRNTSEIPASNEILYKKKAPIGGGVKNIVSLILWNFFLLKTLWKSRKKYTKIHSVDFDTAIPAYLISILFKKEFILDIYDKYTDARQMPYFISKIIDKIEYFCCIKASKLILPDECRIKQLGLPNSIKPIIIENVPLVPSFQKKEEQNIPHFPIIFSYVGILERNNRGLENLIEVISKYPNNVKLHIAGDGELKKYVEEFSQKFENIIYFGAVSQQKALEIMNNSHIIVGMYYKTIKNHLYASPNKYYEHLFLGKVLMTTEGTPPGDKVMAYNTGYALGETIQDIDNFILSVSVEEIQKKSENAERLWNNKYINYYNKVNYI